MVLREGLRLGPADFHGQDVDQRQAVAVPRERLHRQNGCLQHAAASDAASVTSAPTSMGI